ncbi:Puromycin resistance protein pur8 [Frankia sp. AiPs1]|uniref:MFS transporter n=1 Tax=Frankia sp. AiPa1 TaxID=573492 RepID=UPI00202B85F1|nr:MFS transporter [Frankia sp. AiPa1]MCL9762754.1 MFS transporter [Frankia sp. AiPa1]
MPDESGLAQPRHHEPPKQDESPPARSADGHSRNHARRRASHPPAPQGGLTPAASAFSVRDAAPHTPRAAPDPSAGNAVPERRWRILAVLALVQLMIVLDTTVVNIALPYAQVTLGFSNGDRQWVVTAYSLAFGALLLPGGRLADLIGRERALLIGLVGFAAASALGGAARHFTMLVAARAAQGACGALLAPAALALVSTTFATGVDRVKALGIYGGVAAAGASLGLLAGGFATEYLDWRWTLYLNDALAAVALVGVLALLPRRPGEYRARIDLVGTVLVSSGLFAIVYGFGTAVGDAGEARWTHASTIAFPLAGAALLAAFIGWERRTAMPLLPLRIVLDRDRGGSYLAIFLSATGSYAVFLFLAYYLRSTLGLSAVMTGLAFLPMTVMILVTAGVGNVALSSRFAPRSLVPVGMLIAAAGLVLLAHITPDSHYATGVLPGITLFGGGLGLVFGSVFGLGTLGVQGADAGIASATLNVANQIGGSVGTALLNTIATSAVTAYVSGHHSSVPPSRLAAEAAVHSYVVVFWVGAAVCVVTAFLMRMTLRPGLPHLADQESGMHGL